MYLWISTNKNHIQELNLIWDPSLYSLQHAVLTKQKGLQSAMRQNPFQPRAYVSTYSWHKSWSWSCCCCCSQEKELTGLELSPGWSVSCCEWEDILPSVCQQQLLRKHQFLTVPASGIPGREIPAMQVPGTASNLNLGEWVKYLEKNFFNPSICNFTFFSLFFALSYVHNYFLANTPV